jgi:hypothetical protein
MISLKQHEQLSNFGLAKWKVVNAKVRQRVLGVLVWKNSVVPILLLTLCCIMCYPFSVVFLKMPRFLCNAHGKNT